MLTTPVLIVCFALLLLAVLVLLTLFAVRALRARLGDERDAFTALERRQRDDAAIARQEALEQSRQQRAELSSSLLQFGQTLAAQQEQLGRVLAAQLETFGRQLEGLGQRIDERQQGMQNDARAGRAEQAATLHQFGESLAQRLTALGEASTQRLAELRSTVDERLKELQADNAGKLEEMRKTVDEKLHNTLEERLGQSFKLVSERLELVQRGLGEMQSLAAGVGDLKRVLTNVKTRGTWGEVQLGNLLEQILVAEQYAANVATRKGSADKVEYAIRLPGQDSGEQVWLPIDAKFPREDYERLIDAQERADIVGVDDAGRALEARIKAEARTIRDKYIDPPNTTDFALLFLPTEGLYAEVIRRPGLSELLQREYRVTIAGPTTLTALLNSLQMGFRTLAIQQRSSEVWNILGVVKTEFGKFGDVLDKVKKKLDEASNQIDATKVRTRAIARELRAVEALPATSATPLLAALDAGEEDPVDNG